MEISPRTIFEIQSESEILPEILIKFHLQVCRLEVETEAIVSFLNDLQRSDCRLYLKLGCLDDLVDTSGQIYTESSLPSGIHGYCQ